MTFSSEEERQAVKRVLGCVGTTHAMCGTVNETHSYLDKIGYNRVSMMVDSAIIEAPRSPKRSPTKQKKAKK